MALPKLLYVYEETDTNGVSYYVASKDSHEQQEGLVGIYEMRETVEVRHKEQFRKKGKKAEWKIVRWLRINSGRCPECGTHFSEWFIWDGHHRHCYPCWERSGHTYTVLDNGERIAT